MHGKAVEEEHLKVESRGKIAFSSVNFPVVPLGWAWKD